MLFTAKAVPHPDHEMNNKASIRDELDVFLWAQEPLVNHILSNYNPYLE